MTKLHASYRFSYGKEFARGANAWISEVICVARVIVVVVAIAFAAVAIASAVVVIAIADRCNCSSCDFWLNSQWIRG